MRFMVAAALLLLVSLAAAAAAATTTSDSSGTPYRERSEEEMRRIFTEWSRSYRKTDTSAAEEERRYALFCHYLQRIDLHWHNAGYPAWSWDRERSEEEAQRIFVEWKARNGKSYSSIADEEHRYATFKDALREVDRHNVGYTFGVHDSIVGISNLADLTHEEIKVVEELRA
ncbi:oryzain alpha chain-like [Lolium rigidum]|uniref:oryzain alpha chain-like n=1 Tax=Lolium rigidum TaxID=89674 RepID=UPI001F5DAF9C|nr:oryzain alpha chain-like [Lolium rigidum]